MNDPFYMQAALKLARGGIGFTSPNPMVGAVVVKGDQVIAGGYHQKAGAAHAEINALNAAGAAAKGATLYVTLEPCNHTGRTPPCTRGIIAAGVKRVVAAMADPNPGVAGGGASFLEKKGIKVTLGVCEKEARALNEAFIKYVQTRRPFVVAKCAATLDGRIATRSGDSKWITGDASRRFVHRMRHAADAIMVGAGTIAADNPRLTTRLGRKKGADAKRIVLDTRLRISETAAILRMNSDSDTILVTGPLGADAALQEKKTRLQDQGVRFIEAPVENGMIALAPLMVRLGHMEITHLMIEGGGSVTGSALRAGIVDKICFFYAPKIMGGDDAVAMCKGPGPALMQASIGIKDLRVRRFGQDVMLYGYIDKGPPAKTAR